MSLTDDDKGKPLLAEADHHQTVVNVDLTGAGSSESVVDNRHTDEDAFKHQHRLLKWCNVVFFLVQVTINALGSTGKITGNAVGVVSDKYPTRITPDSFAFSIWGPIYFLQAAFVLYQALPRNAASKLLFVDIGWLFPLSCVFNGLWIVTFTIATEVASWVSTVFIAGILLCVLKIYVRAQLWGGELSQPKPWAEFLLVDVMFSMYGGWLTVATIVNISAACVSSNAEWADGSTAEFWSLAMQSVALLVNLAIVAREQDFVFPLVLAWACNAIRAANAANAALARGSMVVSLMALALAAVAAGCRMRRFCKARMSM